MALPHTVVGLICELGMVEAQSKEFLNDTSTVASEEDRHRLRWHEHICTGNKSDIFERHPDSTAKGNHHYFANFPKELLIKVRGTLVDGSEPWDVDEDKHRVSAGYDEDPQDDLPSWMTVWLEPAQCVVDCLTYTYDFETIDEGNPEWSSVNGQSEETYDEVSAHAEAQVLFEAYCDRLRESLQPYQTVSVAENDDTSSKDIYPRWKMEHEYDDPDVEPYEPQTCPTQNDFICPWYKSHVVASDWPAPQTVGFEGLVLMMRVFYDFSFSIIRPDWGPWTITDGTGIYFPEETVTWSYTYTRWYFTGYVEAVPPDEGEYANLPDYPPYWADENNDGVEEWYVPTGWSEEITESGTYTIPERWEFRSYSFDYPMDVRSNYTFTSRWKIKCDYRPNPTCCGPAGRLIVFGIKIYKANLKSAVPPFEDLGQQSPTTKYRNCKLKGYGHGRSGDRRTTAGRGIRYFEGHGCPTVPSGEVSTTPYMPWAYYGTMVRPIQTTSQQESILYVSKFIGQEWPEAYDIELPSYDGKVTYIKDFWIESISNA